jgi:hypothetical protein
MNRLDGEGDRLGGEATVFGRSIEESLESQGLLRAYPVETFVAATLHQPVARAFQSFLRRAWKILISVTL